MRKAKVTTEMFGKRIYCSPAYAAVETTSSIIDGLLGATKDKVEICVEEGLFTYPSRFRVFPSFVEPSELAWHYPNRVVGSYQSVVSKSKLNVKESVNNFYARYCTKLIYYLLKCPEKLFHSKQQLRAV